MTEKYKIELTRKELEMVYETVSIKLANDRYMKSMVKAGKAFGDMDLIDMKLKTTTETYQTLRDALNE